MAWPLNTTETEIARGQSLGMRCDVILYRGAGGWVPAGSREISVEPRWGVAFAMDNCRMGQYWRDCAGPEGWSETQARDRFERMTGSRG